MMYQEKVNKKLMNPHRKISIGLLIALLAFAPGEWGRVKDWFMHLSPIRQWLVGTLVALTITVVLAWIFQTRLNHLIKYLML